MFIAPAPTVKNGEHSRLHADQLMRNEIDKVGSSMANMKEISESENDQSRRKTVRKARTRGGGVMATRSRTNALKRNQKEDICENGNDEKVVQSVFICEICDLKFECKESLLAHKRRNHLTNVTSSTPPERMSADDRRRKLSKFTDAQIISKLVEKGAIFQCICGMIFKEQTLYFLHRGCHNSEDPKKCSFCDFKAQDWYDFTTHFFIHKKKNDGNSGVFNDISQTYSHFLPVSQTVQWSDSTQDLPHFSSILPPIATISRAAPSHQDVVPNSTHAQ